MIVFLYIRIGFLFGIIWRIVQILGLRIAPKLKIILVNKKDNRSAFWAVESLMNEDRSLFITLRKIKTCRNFFARPCKYLKCRLEGIHYKCFHSIDFLFSSACFVSHVLLNSALNVSSDRLGEKQERGREGMRFIGFSHPPIIHPSLARSLPSIASRGMSTMEKEGSTEKALIDSADRSKEQGSVSSLGIGPIFVLLYKLTHVVGGEVSHYINIFWDPFFSLPKFEINFINDWLELYVYSED